jgi:transketolase
MQLMNINYINKKIKEIKKNIVGLSYDSGSAHLGSSLSCIEILLACFIYKSKKKNTEIIFSKGHAAMAYYALLFSFKVINKHQLKNYLKNNSKLWAHITRKKNNEYFKFSFGSLGYGLGICAGLGVASKILNKKKKLFCILSDGELNEGSIWEALLFISHHQLKNFFILIDSNKIQSFGRTKDIINISNLDKILSNLNFVVKTINGHDVSKIFSVLDKNFSKPVVLICNTVKGNGIKEIEDTISSHYKPATYQQKYKVENEK